MIAAACLNIGRCIYKISTGGLGEYLKRCGYLLKDTDICEKITLDNEKIHSDGGKTLLDGEKIRSDDVKMRLAAERWS